MRITLPWPPKQLSPNARVHWRQKAECVKSFRALCRWSAYTQGARPLVKDIVPMTITFHPPDARRRDRDNMIASCKALMDGLSDAFGVDDAYFIPTYAVGNIVASGAVVIDLTKSKEPL
jgi:crossover junction endodeoxyribonuclease RusA